ncbi:hypothetical protein WDV06_36055 [Streptomyces racemochromogenes]|uniref:Uncharacterized protein n=1 Tax=Streptomyces racemochromogenes TaxID=67353 RepID=A0ABW7PPX7_9ACTN
MKIIEAELSASHPALIEKWTSYQVLDTERQDRRRGYVAAWRYRKREGDLDPVRAHGGRLPAG